MDYIFISNSIQEHVSNTDILTALATDHSPVIITLNKGNKFRNGLGTWKFNNSLTLDENFIKTLKSFISDLVNTLEVKHNHQLRWELIKYEVRKFTIHYSKEKAKKQRKLKQELETRLLYIDSNIQNKNDHVDYIKYKTELEHIYDNIAEGIRIRSKCNWYEYGEKSSKYFLSLEKRNAKKSIITKLLVSEDKEIDCPMKITKEIKQFYQTLFKNSIHKTENECLQFLQCVSTTKLTENESDSCEDDLTEKELYEALTSMSKEKSPGNDGLTKEYYVTFWDQLKIPFMKSLEESKTKGYLTISQRQAIIKLLEKKDRDKRYIKNWRPISLLNVDLKIISKAIAAKLKNVMPSIISSNQTAYVKNRFIGENGRLISDIIEICDSLQIEGYLVTVDIEKAFDSLNHTFLLATLKKFGFGENFIQWITILLKNQESCVVNGGTTTGYFNLERGARQGISHSCILIHFSIRNWIFNDKTKPKNYRYQYIWTCIYLFCIC